MLHCFVNTSDCHFILSANSLKRFFITSLCYPLVTKESLFCHQREPLFSKSGKSDFFCLKKLAMSLIRAIFALETVGKWPLSDSFFQSALSFDDVALARQSKQASSALTLRNVRSAFALPPLWLRFRRRRKALGNAVAETRHKQEVFDRFA